MNIAIYFSTIAERNISSWLELLKSLTDIGHKICLIFDKKGGLEDKFVKKYKIIYRSYIDITKVNDIYQNLGRYDDFPIIRSLRKAPYYSKPKRRFQSKENEYEIAKSISKQINVWEKILNKHSIETIFVMEPKNFAYNPFVVILEQVCQKQGVGFNFIHGAFLLTNIKIFDNLNRVDNQIFDNYISSNKVNSKEKHELQRYIKKYCRLKYGDVFSNLINKGGNEVNISTIDIDRLKPYILLFPGKPNNQREFFVNPHWSMDHIFMKNLLIHTPTNINVVIKAHPHTSRNSKYKKQLRKLLSKYRKATYYQGNTNIVNLIRNSELVLTAASHSFMDGLLHYKKVGVFGSKNFLFGTRKGPFYRINSFEQYSETIVDILKSDLDSDSIDRFIYSIIRTIEDPYFSIEQVEERLRSGKTIIHPHKSKELIFNFFK